MAKLTITFENGEIKKELIFRGEKFDYKMLKSEYAGMKSNKPSIGWQIGERFGVNFTDDEEIQDDLDAIDFGDEDEIYKSLNHLTEIEIYL